jgi:putative CocE/NonD family hydrolase
LWLAGDGRLQESEPASGAAGADRYRYDPAEPTPSLGGPGLLARDPVRDNRWLETRSDVLTYTTAPLPAPLEAIGAVRVELWARASSPYFDLFARVCDVDASGASWNVCDALQRVDPDHFEPIDDTWPVAFELWPTAHRFAAGNRIRLQVSSGAYPRYARNPGTGEDPATAASLRAVDVEILRGPRQRAALILQAALSASS